MAQKAVVIAATVTLVGLISAPAEADDDPQFVTWDFVGESYPWLWESEHPLIPDEIEDVGLLSATMVCDQSGCDTWQFTFIGAHGSVNCKLNNQGFTGFLEVHWTKDIHEVNCEDGDLAVYSAVEPPIGPVCEADASATGEHSSFGKLSGSGIGSGLCNVAAV